MSRGVTNVGHAELVELATQQVARGVIDVVARPLPHETGAGRAVIRGFTRVLLALDRHVLALVGHPQRRLPDQLAEPGSPREVDLRRFVDELHRSVRSLSGTFGGHPGLPVAWGDAARTLGAATDLLRTHFDPAGLPRSPMSEDLLADPRHVEAGLVASAEIARLLLGAYDPVALRVAQAGVSWVEVRQDLPSVSELTGSVERVWQSRHSLEAANPLGSLTVARPALARAEPISELRSRLDQVRHDAWQLERQAHVDLRDLDAIAASAVIVHRLSRAWIEVMPSSLAPSARAAAQIDAIEAWTEVRLNLRQVHSVPTSPARPLVDARALAELATRLTPSTGQVSAEIVRTFDLADRILGEAAARNGSTISAMADRGQLYVRGRHLRGDDITDYPRLVEAKLHDTLTPIPPGHLDRIVSGYRAAAQLEAPSARATSTTRRHRRARAMTR